MPLVLYDFTLDAGADWQKTIRLRDPGTGLLVPLDAAVMEIRNSNKVLVLRLDAPSGRCLISADDGASIQLSISHSDSLAAFQWGNYPGAVQAVGIWGIGRSYVYDLFAQYNPAGALQRIMRGYFNVDPNITQVTPQATPQLAVRGT
jgi:hypothetical protein